MTTQVRQRRRRIGTRPDPGLPRARLLHKLNGADYRVALITAPAGFGKSTLLTQYATFCTTMVVDYVVDSTDVAPGALLQGILTALRHDTTPPPVVSPVADDCTWSLMASVLDRLTELGDSCVGGLTCILDDLQFIEGSAAVDELSALITHLPQGVRMVLSARRMPPLDLATHRVAGAVVELDADDLRFRSWEIEQLFAGYIHASVGLCAHRVDDGMVVVGEVSVGDVLAKLDMTVKAKVGISSNTVIQFGDALDLLMIGGNTTAYQAVRGGQTVKHINLSDQISLRLQMTCRIKSGWPGTDDRNPQWVSLCSQWFSHS